MIFMRAFAWGLLFGCCCFLQLHFPARLDAIYRSCDGILRADRRDQHFGWMKLRISFSISLLLSFRLILVNCILITLPSSVRCRRTDIIRSSTLYLYIRMFICIHQHHTQLQKPIKTEDPYPPPSPLSSPIPPPPAAHSSPRE